MAIISFTFDKMQVERLNPLETPLKVEFNMRVLDVKEEDVAVGAGRKEKVLRFFFEFKVDYTPKQAYILLEGNLVYFDEKEDADKVVKEWKKNKKLSAEVSQQVMNNILIRSNVKSLLLGQEIGLPPHIVLPTLQNIPKSSKEDQKKAEEYIG